MFITLRLPRFLMLAASIVAGVSNPIAAQVPRTSALPDTRTIDALFARFKQPGSSGCALSVIRDGNFIYRGNYGLANLELGVPLSDKSVFYLGSVSKHFTAAATLLGREVADMYLKDAFDPLPKLLSATARPVAAATMPKPVEPPHLTPDQLADFVGNYQSEESDAIYRVALSGSGLMMRNGWNPAFKLSPIFADTFNGDYLTLKFVRDASGQVTGISVATPYTQNHPFKRIDPRALAN